MQIGTKTITKGGQGIAKATHETMNDSKAISPQGICNVLRFAIRHIKFVGTKIVIFFQ